MVCLNLNFVVLSLFALNFQHHNFADIVYAQTATLHTNVKKVKSQSTTTLMFFCGTF